MNSDPISLIKKHINQPPIDIEAVVKDFGLELVQSPLKDDVSGFIEKKTDGTYRITVNASHSETRRRFTIAHELAHYIYHRDLFGNGVADSRAYRSEGTPLENANITRAHELQANSFAANVLMPKSLLADRMHEKPETLANEFKVSPAAMKIRLGVE